MDSAVQNRALSVSVVICCYKFDRWQDVLDAVASVRNQTNPPDELIVVVDHNPHLYKELRDALPDVTVVENRYERGLSGGKNTGIDIASGEVVAFLDDDAVADAQWLLHLREAYSSPGIAGVGGSTHPLWETARPRWFPEEFDWVVGCTFIGREPGVVRNLLGGNASFRRDIFAAVGGFSTDMGRSSSHARPLACEETEFCIRATQHRPDWTFVFEPRAVISHRVPAPRERFAYFRSRCFAEGWSKAAVARTVGHADGLSVELRYTTRTLTRGVIRGFGEAFRGRRAGLERSVAICVGLLTTSVGYVAGMAAHYRSHRGSHSAKSDAG